MEDKQKTIQQKSDTNTGQTSNVKYIAITF